MLITCLKLFTAFFRIGLFTFGGGMAMLPMLENEMDRMGLSKREILDFFSLGQTLPGVIAINSATLIGRKLAGFGGGVAATLGVIAPSYIVIILIIVLFRNYLTYPQVQSAFMGIRAASAALIISSGLRITTHALTPVHGDQKPRRRLSFFSFFIFILTLLLLPLGINPFFLILLAAALGIIRYGLIRRSANPKEPPC